MNRFFCYVLILDWYKFAWYGSFRNWKLILLYLSHIIKKQCGVLQCISTATYNSYKIVINENFLEYITENYFVTYRYYQFYQLYWGRQQKFIHVFFFKISNISFWRQGEKFKRQSVGTFSYIPLLQCCKRYLTLSYSG